MVLKQGDLENIILNALWDLEQQGVHPVFVSQVQQQILHLNKRWAYTTVKTVLDRLVEKELAVREKHGKKFGYLSQVKREDAGILAIEKVMRQYFHNDVDALAICLEKLRPGSQSAVTQPTAVSDQ
jgi:predicted transcriptional regulator